MKKTKIILPFILTVIIICFGFVMPKLSSLALDYHMQKQIEENKNNNVSLILSESEDYFERISLFSELSVNLHSSLELSENSNMCNLKADEVKNIADDLILKISSDKIIQDNPQITPVLIVSTEEENLTEKGELKSGIFWQCIWIDIYNRTHLLWLDDESGLMVGYMINDIRPAETTDTFEYEKELTDSTDGEKLPPMVAFLENYCRENYSYNNVECNSYGDGMYDLILTRTDKDNIFTYTVSVYLQNNEVIFFNM